MGEDELGVCRYEEKKSQFVALYQHERNEQLEKTMKASRCGWLARVAVARAWLSEWSRPQPADEPAKPAIDPSTLRSITTLPTTRQRVDC